mmetsp:Transcript_15829/g.33832  ORF Transcript_15829/g.33832 Transcript_15829/m.33832 type:complete len:258 (-) Transcript_15829:680-1453(-)
MLTCSTQLLRAPTAAPQFARFSTVTCWQLGRKPSSQNQFVFAISAISTTSVQSRQLRVQRAHVRPRGAHRTRDPLLRPCARRARQLRPVSHLQAAAPRPRAHQAQADWVRRGWQRPPCAHSRAKGRKGGDGAQAVRERQQERQERQGRRRRQALDHWQQPAQEEAAARLRSGRDARKTSPPGLGWARPSRASAAAPRRPITSDLPSPPPTHVHTHIHTHIHTYTHTHIHTWSPPAEVIHGFFTSRVTLAIETPCFSI